MLTCSNHLLKSRMAHRIWFLIPRFGYRFRGSTTRAVYAAARLTLGSSAFLAPPPFTCPRHCLETFRNMDAPSKLRYCCMQDGQSMYQLSPVGHLVSCSRRTNVRFSLYHTWAQKVGSQLTPHQLQFAQVQFCTNQPCLRMIELYKTSFTLLSLGLHGIRVGPISAIFRIQVRNIFHDG